MLDYPLYHSKFSFSVILIKMLAIPSQSLIKSRTFTNVEIKLLPGAGSLVIVPAISGKLIVPICGIYKPSIVTNYVGVGVDDFLELTIGGADVLEELVNEAGATPAIDDLIKLFALNMSFLVTPRKFSPLNVSRAAWPSNPTRLASTCVGQALKLLYNGNSSDPLTGGDSANTLTVSISYFVV